MSFSSTTTPLYPSASSPNNVLNDVSLPFDYRSSPLLELRHPGNGGHHVLIARYRPHSHSDIRRVIGNSHAPGEYIFFSSLNPCRRAPRNVSKPSHPPPRSPPTSLGARSLSSPVSFFIKRSGSCEGPRSSWVEASSHHVESLTQS